MAVPRSTTALLFALALSLGPAASPAAAQQTPQAETLAVPAAAAAFDAATLRAFARAFIEVALIAQAYEGAIVGAGTPERQAQLTLEANTAVLAAVDDIEGITVAQYDQIVQAAQADPALADQIQTLVNEVAIETGLQ